MWWINRKPELANQRHNCLSLGASQKAHERIDHRMSAAPSKPKKKTVPPIKPKTQRTKKINWSIGLKDGQPYLVPQEVSLLWWRPSENLALEQSLDLIPRMQEYHWISAPHSVLNCSIYLY